jgi:hypothetical protein
MSKYKAGDIVTIRYKLTEDSLNILNKGGNHPDGEIISHERAPEPVVTYNALFKDGYIADGYKTLEALKNEVDHDEKVVGYFKTTYLGNDFTVEKCDE